MANIIASGVTELASADLVVAAGVPTTIHMSDANGGTISAAAKAKVYLQIKTAAGALYVTVGELTRDKPALVIDGPGTYRALRAACKAAIVVDQD